MSWSGVLSTLDSHLATAAAAINALDATQEPFIVRPGGEPFSAVARQVSYWYEGDQESTTGGNTFGKANRMEKLTIRWYWPMLSRDPVFATRVEVQMEAANRATQAAIMGDDHLGENAIATFIEETTAGWQQVSEAWIRVLTIPIRIDLAWTEDIHN